VNTIEFQEISIEKLLPFQIRELRQDVLNNLEKRISERKYNNARPVTVVRNNGHFNVIDGNHRLAVAKKLTLPSLPCVIYPDGENVYKLAIEGNLDEDTYAPMDLFDWLDIIKKLKEEGMTQKEIGEKIGWSEGDVKKHSMLINNIVPQNLEICKSIQEGRGTDKVPFVTTFNFTEGWFRNSGLYDLRNCCYNFQEKIIRNFINSGCCWSKEKLQQETAKYKLWNRFISIAKEKLSDLNNLQTVIDLILNNTFKTEETLLKKIEQLNKESENKLICGDALIELEKLDDATIDIVITDPPYGIDYVSNRSEYSDSVTSEGIENDKPEEAFSLLQDACEVLNKKTKADAHFYIFTSWKVYPEFRQIIEKHFTIKSLIIWDKGNHGAGDLEGAWGNKYEMIIYATKGNRSLRKRKQDIIPVAKIPSIELIHPTQKPVQLIKELIDASAQKTDTICDPFMGSGSTIKAVKEMKDLDLKFIIHRKN
jgi:site-specific DNA-methyltransferase (adenine-specific)